MRPHAGPFSLPVKFGRYLFAPEPPQFPSHWVQTVELRIVSISSAAARNLVCRPTLERSLNESLTTTFVFPSTDARTPMLGVSNAQRNARPSSVVNSMRSKSRNISNIFSCPILPDFRVSI
jgi:hypothetical protein